MTGLQRPNVAGDDLFREALLGGGQHKKCHCGRASDAETKAHRRVKPRVKV
jgi:hypothetical protein